MPEPARLIIWTCGVLFIVVVAVAGIDWANHRKEDQDIRKILEDENHQRGGGAE